MIGPSDLVPASSLRRDRRETRGEGLSEIPIVDVDMAAHLIMDGAVFPAGAPPASAAPAEDIHNEAPTARAGLAAGLMLALRFVQARFLSVWGLLIAAALCPAQAFADFALFSALANFVSLAVLMRFEAVFFQNDDRARLGRAFRLSAAAGAAFMVAVGLCVFASAALGWVGAAYGALFMVSLGARGFIRLISSEATAEGDFATIGNSNIVQALVQPIMMLLLIWLLDASALALLAADAIGHAVVAGYVAWRRRDAVVRLVRPDLWSRSELRQSASLWRAAPRFLLPSALLSFGFMVAPLLALPYASNPLLAAHVALAMRLLEVPTQMFSAVSVPLVLVRLRAQAAESRQLWVRFFTVCLITAAALLFSAIAGAALQADAVLDGTQWEGVGEVVAILALFYGSIALVAPLHEIAALSRNPRRQVLTNAFALLAAALVMAWFGTLSLSLLCAMGVVSLMRMAAHVQFAWTRLGPDSFAVARG